MRPLIPTLLIFTGLSLAAADATSDLGTDREHHLRLTVQSLPKKLHGEISASGEVSGATSSDVTADSAGRLGIGYTYTSPREVGLLLGTGLDFSSLVFKDNDVKTEIAQTGIHLEPGVSWRVAGGFSVESGILLGVGAVKTTVNIPGVNIKDTTYYEVSPRVRGVYQFQNGLELLAEFGYHYQRFDYETSSQGVNVTVKATSEGGYAGLGLGWAF
jgi:hypothetical protein